MAHALAANLGNELTAQHLRYKNIHIRTCVTSRGTQGHLRHGLHLPHRGRRTGTHQTGRALRNGRTRRDRARGLRARIPTHCSHTSCPVPHTPTTRTLGAMITHGTTDKTTCGLDTFGRRDTARTHTSSGRLRPRRVRGHYERATPSSQHGGTTQRRHNGHASSCKGRASGGRARG